MAQPGGSRLPVLGGLASASSLLAAFAQAHGDSELARASKVGAAAAIGLSGAALVKDLGRPARFLNMLRVFKVTSPMSVGSGRAGRLMEAGEVLTAAGLSGAVLAGRSRTAAALSGLALMAASACTRFGVFEAGRASARDPAATIGPQRQRLRDRLRASDRKISHPERKRLSRQA